MQKIMDIMTRDILWMAAEQTVAKAAALMQERGATTVAVEMDGKLVGILTESDIAIQAITILPQTRIRDVIDGAVERCHDDDDAEVVARHMAELGVRRLPVVNRQDHIVGFVSLNDALRRASPAAATTH